MQVIGSLRGFKRGVEEGFSKTGAIDTTGPPHGPTQDTRVAFITQTGRARASFRLEKEATFSPCGKTNATAVQYCCAIKTQTEKVLATRGTLYVLPVHSSPPPAAAV